MSSNSGDELTLSSQKLPPSSHHVEEDPSFASGRYSLHFLMANALSRDERSRAVIGEQLDQHCMGNLAVKDHYALDAPLQRIDAGLDLGDHAAGDRAVGDERADVVDLEFLDELAAVVEDPRHVGQE